jgi:hypothetical protein
MVVLETCLPQHLGLRRGGLRRTITTSIAVVATGLLIGRLIITIIVFAPSGVSSAMAEAFGVGLTVAEVAVSLGSTIFSSGASFSLSESSRMITLPSPGGLRMPRLRSPESFLVNFSSREVSAMKFFSSEDKERSITGAFPEELPFSKTGEQGRREEISDRDPGGGRDLDDAGGGVLASLGEGFSSGEGERSRLMPPWSSIDGEQRAREGEP